MNMQSIWLVVITSLFPFTSLAFSEQLSLLPVPSSVKMGEGKFRLTSGFAIAPDGWQGDRLCSAASRMLRRLSDRTGLFFSQDYVSRLASPDSAAMVITCKREGRLILREDEAYVLTITRSAITLATETDLGVLRGIETLLQLVSVDAEGYFFPVVTIDDAPRFPWRGLMIDVSRHFMPLEVLKRNLDGMAAVKMNVFHWHLTDDQGFRIESRTHPELHQRGSDGFFYTQEQVRDLIMYAADRGIRVIPEFDLPGHATSWFVSHPELASAPGPYTVERKWGIFNPTMDPTQEATYRLLDEFIGEMAFLFPDEYLHIGGDENNGKQWNANEAIRAFMKRNAIADNHALQTYFNNRLLRILTKHGKKMIGWDEILHPDMPKNIVIQSWRGQKGLLDAARQGYQAILSNGYYIDLIQPAEYHYLNDPLPGDSALTQEERGRVLGGEATSWGELVSPETIDSRIWPRTASIAERLWSSTVVRDVEDMYRRMGVVSVRLEELGLLHIKNQAMMLRRLSNNTDTTPLNVFVNVVEPVKIYARHFQGVSYTSFSPLTRVVDAAPPESEEARIFRRTVTNYIRTNDRSAETAILSSLDRWKRNHPLLKATIAASPVLREIESLSEDLARLSEIGIGAIHLLQKKEEAMPAWITESKGVIERARKPRGQVELAVLPAILQLVDAAASTR